MIHRDYYVSAARKEGGWFHRRYGLDIHTHTQDGRPIRAHVTSRRFWPLVNHMDSVDSAVRSTVRLREFSGNVEPEVTGVFWLVSDAFASAIRKYGIRISDVTVSPRHPRA